MYATNISIKSINTMNNIATTDIKPFKTAPRDTVIKTTQVRDNMMIWPARVLAKRRIIKAKGLVKRPKISMSGINGIGAFIQTGTSGHKISFQYVLEPKMFTMKNVNIARTNVMAILPVKFAPPGKIGTNPMILLTKMKKKAVRR